MKCVAYMRVSTEKQAEEGNGLDSQKRDIEIYARKNELIIDEWFIDDGYTGTNMNRPALQRLIDNAIKKNFDCVIAFKLDRLSRSMVDGIYIIERIFLPNNVQLRCVHDSVSYDSPMEQAYTQMMAVFAQLDKNTMLLRMKGGKLERAKQGYFRGGGHLPIGYDYCKEKKSLTINDRANDVKKVYEMFIDGYTLEQIADRCNISSNVMVQKILRNPVYIGKLRYKGEVYQGLHDPIISEEIFEKAQMLINGRRKVRIGGSHLLTGLCFCGKCGCAMRYQLYRNGNYKIFCYSRVSYGHHIPNHTPGCDNGLFWAQDIEKLVEKEITKISIDSKEVPKPEIKSELLKRKLDSERTKLKRLYNLYTEGNDDVIEMIREKENLIAELKHEIDKQEEVENNSIPNDYIFSQIKSVKDIWKVANTTDKNRLLKTIINKVYINNGNIEIELKYQ